MLHIYIYDISSLRVNDLTLILLTWRKLLAPNNASRQQMGFNSGFKGLIRNVPTLAHCALCNMITAIGLTMRSHMPNIYIRLHMPNFHFDPVMPFPLLVYWAWECEASWVLTDVSCLLLNKLTMAVALICVPNIFFLSNMKTAVLDAPPLNSDVQSFQNFTSSLLCQWEPAIELLQQIFASFICQYLQITLNMLFYVTLPTKLKLSVTIYML